MYSSDETLLWRCNYREFTETVLHILLTMYLMIRLNSCPDATKLSSTSLSTKTAPSTTNSNERSTTNLSFAGVRQCNMISFAGVRNVTLMISCSHYWGNPFIMLMSILVRADMTFIARSKIGSGLKVAHIHSSGKFKFFVPFDFILSFVSYVVDWGWYKMLNIWIASW